MRTRLVLLALTAATAALAPTASAGPGYSLSVTPEEGAQDVTRPVRVAVTVHDPGRQNKGIGIRITNGDPSFTRVVRTDGSGRATTELRNSSGEARDEVFYVEADADRDDRYTGDKRVEVVVHWTRAGADDTYDDAGGYRTVDTDRDVLTMLAQPASAGYLDLGYGSRNFRLRWDRGDVFRRAGEAISYEQFERVLRSDPQVKVSVVYRTGGVSQWRLDPTVLDRVNVG